jgi:hypothetical protein
MKAKYVASDPMETIIARFAAMLNVWPNVLRQIPLPAWERRTTADKWSKKEILGHLIDSAANNHQRFVRLQYEKAVSISYDQDQWVAISLYSEAPLEDLIMLWESYNRHLLHIIRATVAQGYLEALPPDVRKRLEFFIEDYIRHLEHHLKQIK